MPSTKRTVVVKKELTGPLAVLVCGGRDFDDYEWMHGVLYPLPIGIIIQGDAKGADALARKYARDMDIVLARVPALWKSHGKGAGPRRNLAMLLLKPDLVVAFPGGKGTAHMVQATLRAGIPLIEERL